MVDPHSRVRAFDGVVAVRAVMVAALMLTGCAQQIAPAPPMVAEQAVAAPAPAPQIVYVDRPVIVEKHVVVDRPVIVEKKVIVKQQPETRVIIVEAPRPAEPVPDPVPGRPQPEARRGETLPTVPSSAPKRQPVKKVQGACKGQAEAVCKSLTACAWTAGRVTQAGTRVAPFCRTTTAR